MTLGYYPGCSLEGISTEYDISMRNLFRKLEIETQDLEDWICCGTLAAPSASRLLGLATPLWNMARAKQSDFEFLITPCSACLYHFKNAAKLVEEDAELLNEVESVLHMSLEATPQAIHPLELLATDEFEERIQARITPECANNKLKVVTYYGCHISRPAEVMKFDDPEDPNSMDQILRWANVEVMEWSCKVDCCGAHFSLVKPDVVIDLCHKIFEGALEAGAEAIVVACPMCHANLDTRQKEIGQRLGMQLEMPILYFSQVLGQAMGLSDEELGLKKHIVDPRPLLRTNCLELPVSSAREIAE